ncbi:MAG: hypothetical protein HRT77_12825 [Halioglobus sp.]|nr:hypothetical protein [Halioglobus sp.]
MTTNFSYCLKTLALTGLGLGMLGAINIAIDPYQLMGTPALKDLNLKKTEIFLQLPVTKPYQFMLSDYSNVILGSSRAGRSIDPNHAAIRSDRYYNFATPGATPEIDFLKFMSAVNFKDVKKAIYFVDFFTFNTFYSIPESSTNAFRRRTSLRGAIWQEPGFLLQALRDYTSGLWAYQTLRDSVRTIRNQKHAQSGHYPHTELHDNGLWHFAFVTDRKPITAFNFMEQVYIRDTWFFPDSRTFSLQESKETPNHPFFYFQSLLELAHDTDVELEIVILPIHARLLDTLEYAGLWESFEDWKRHLVTINAHAARARDQAPFGIWDFNGYYPELFDLLDEETASSELKWFFDSAHITTDTGDRILDYITGDHSTGFGGKIDAENIEGWLLRQRKLKDAYRAAYPHATEEVRLRIDRLLERFPGQVEAISQLELEINKLGAPEHPDD